MTIYRQPALRVLASAFVFISAAVFLTMANPALAEVKTAPETTAAGKADTARFEGLMPRSGNASVSYGAPEPASGSDTHPTLSLTPDKSELIRLDADAASIIIGSGEHLGAVAESGRLIILVPRLPGATYLTILDADGKVLMQRHVVVSVPKEKYVRIRRTCAANNNNCESTTVYYCPDMCHRVGLVQPGPDVVTQSGAAAAAGGTAPASAPTMNINTENINVGSDADGDTPQ